LKEIIVTFRPNAPHKKRRWLAVLAVAMLGTGIVGVGTVLAAPTFNFVQDEQGANDEPGQKDLTADATAIDSVTGDYFTAWKWDDLSWSGNNTGDACSLFDTDADGKANVAVCVTIGKPAVETSTRVYSCTDNRSDRCTGATLVGTESASTSDWCTVTSPVTATFPPPPSGGDTQATCDITLIDAEVTAVSGLNNGTFLNSCSYPSQEPNSDPSDCVHRIASVDVAVSTTSAGTIAWTATLSDSATLNPSTATGSVTFNLYSDSTCTTKIWTSDADTTAPFSSGTTGGTPSGGNVITDLTVNSDGKYYWIADYTSNSAAFNNDSSTCGELVTIVATVTGS
jgi:hypothetical protein